MFCTNCGKKNEDGARFCTECGAPLVAVPAPGVPAAPAPVTTSAAAPAHVATPAPTPAPDRKPTSRKKALVVRLVAAAVVVAVAVAARVVAPGMSASQNPSAADATAVGGSAGDAPSSSQPAQTHDSPFAGAQVGDIVQFGTYSQDGSGSKEPIEWQVLDVGGDQAVVISRKGLLPSPFNDSTTKGNDWESSDLRAWLVDVFPSVAFTDEERELLADEPTLLSLDEVEKYFPSGAERVCEPTQSAVNAGAYLQDGACIWWLRTPGDFSDRVAMVDTAGTVYAGGSEVSLNNLVVRPVLRVKM